VTTEKQTMEIGLVVNGQKVNRSVNPKASLMRFLRDDLQMTGTKDGCTTGDCGTCVVLVNGKPVDSCLFLMRRAEGIEVQTIEGLAPSEGCLHPLQAAFMECGAVQCGFCTPGMLMASKALLDEHPSPTEDQIRTGLKDVICRCTGYTQIFEALTKASEWIADPTEFADWRPRSGSMGVSAALVDSEEAVTGRLIYADDMTEEGLLYGQVVWSQHPYAKIEKVDASKAERAPGVVRVVTSRDVPGLNAHGRTTPDQPVFCSDYVRYTGDLVALVLAESRDQASAAAKLVEVVYQELDGLFSPEQSLKKGAPQLHSSGNICKQLVHVVGDVDSALKSATHRVEGHFETQRVDHAYLEPIVALARVTDDGGVVVHAPTQAPFETREQLVKILDLPREKVRVISPPIGGAFGGKLEIVIEAAAAIAALCTRRPVKITLTREETLHAAVKRHPYKMDYRVGMDEEGRLLGVDAKLVADAGPYTGNSPRVIDQACIFSCGPYRVPHLRVEGVSVLTNNANCGAFRGYGINQSAVSMEQLMDELAEKVGMDPFEIRKINMLVVGDETITGQFLPSSVGAIATLEACQKALQEEWPQYRSREREGYRIGYGVASGYKNVGAGKGKVDDAGASFILQPNGRVKLVVSVIDMGQAIRTTMVQFACRSTGLDPSCFDLVTGDTALTHSHRSASGQRQTLIAGNAVVMAGKLFKENLLNAVAQWTEIPYIGGYNPPELVIDGKKIRTEWSQYREEETIMSLAEVAERAIKEGVVLESEAEYVAPKTYPLSDTEARKKIPREEYRNYPTYAYATQVAIVEVEEATGQVEVLRVIAAHDVGVAVNPQQIRGQLIGSIAMGQGYALTEDYPMSNGLPPHRHVTFGRLGVPSSVAATSVRVEIVEDPFPEGPYGAKGISEIATVPITPAILNAIYRATGVRVYTIPADPALLKEAMCSSSS